MTQNGFPVLRIVRWFHLSSCAYLGWFEITPHSSSLSICLADTTPTLFRSIEFVFFTINGACKGFQGFAACMCTEYVRRATNEENNGGSLGLERAGALSRSFCNTFVRRYATSRVWCGRIAFFINLISPVILSLLKKNILVMTVG